MSEQDVILEALKEDSLELIQGLNTNLLSLEKNPGQKECWTDVMRGLHNLKGLSKVMGFENIETLSHRLEDIVRLINEEKITFSASMLNVILKGVDAIDLLLKAVINKQTVDYDITPIMGQLDKIAKGEPLDTLDTKPDSKIPRQKEKPDKEPEKQNEELVSPAIAASPAHSPGQDSIRIKTEKLDYLLNLASEMIIDRICMNKEIKDMEKIQDSFYREIQEWHKFSLEWRNKFFLINNQGMSDINLRLNKNIQNIFGLKEQFDNLFHNHSRTISHHNTIISDYQNRIMGTRMLPISVLFSTFPRMVRDLSNQFGKEINLVIEGEETEVDKKIIENLRDPLIHIIRNSIDHGIEAPDERIKKGKPGAGEIKLAVSYQGNQLKINISDNGQGINIEKINIKKKKKKTIEKKIYTEKDIESLKKKDLINLIFKPGFSTKDIITSLSGRGVGMDVVLHNIKILNGSIDVESDSSGIGTNIILLIPLSLTTTNILIVRVKGQLMGIPSLNVEEAINIKYEDIHTIEGREAISVHDHIIPLVWMDITLNIRKKKQKEGRPDILSAVILGSEQKRIAFVVDELVDEHEVVVKSIEDKLQNISAVIGATILGSGEVDLILSPFELMIKAREKEIRNLMEKTDKKTKAEAPSVLVVDDQLTIRQLQKIILESYGYKVVLAKNGKDALEQLAKLNINLVITDIQMPEMDGLTLVKMIKSDENYKKIPVVIVSSLGSEEDKKKGISVGANAYITKAEFNQQNLLEIINSLIM
ncbi:hybrid sensor histidine kinase/response regulator [Candidatus Desantisbacteria bacterium]|nr:hybrid sensor histidine kinase/response regulator [Candidatus Desantisbacteria bacterium]